MGILGKGGDSELGPDLSPEDMMTDEQRAINEKREKVATKVDFEVALNEVCEKYPELSEKIRSSLETPQLGEHHNEGPRMDSHLVLILKTIDSIKDGQFHESVTEAGLKDVMTGVAVRQEAEKIIINPALIDYTFLHDISKSDCLTLKVEGEKKGVEITWEQWKWIEQSGAPYKLDGKPITSISYFHPSEGAVGQHGNKAAELLKDKKVPMEIISAISKHEVAYQFGKISAAAYEEHFVKPGFSTEQQRFILVASYIDTMASLGQDGQPDLTNFSNLAKSRDNYLLIKQYTDKGTIFRANELAALKKQDRVLTVEDVEKIIPHADKYNLSVLEEKLDTLVFGGQISVGEKEEILSLVSSPEELGKKFGPKKRLIKPVLEQSKE